MNPAFLEELKRDTRPVTPLRPAWVYFCAAMLLAGAIATAGVFALGTAGWRALSQVSWALLAPGILVMMAGGAVAASQWMSPTGKASLGPAIAALGLAWVGLFAGAGGGEYSAAHALKCFSIASFFSLLAATGAFFIFRRGVGLRRLPQSLAVGVFAGAVGFLVIQILCPITDLGHLLSGHGLVPLAWGLAAPGFVRLFSGSEHRL